MCLWAGLGIAHTVSSAWVIRAWEKERERAWIAELASLLQFRWMSYKSGRGSDSTHVVLEGKTISSVLARLGDWNMKVLWKRRIFIINIRLSFFFFFDLDLHYFLERNCVNVLWGCFKKNVDLEKVYRKLFIEYFLWQDLNIGIFHIIFVILMKCF